MTIALPATIVTRFAEQVKKFPTTVALEKDNKKITYQELDDESNKLAHYIQDLYVTNEIDIEGAVIALCLPRSFHQVVSILAVLKLGIAYVPLDPEYPEERMEKIIQDCGAKYIITELSLAPRINGYFKAKEVPPILIEADDELLTESYPSDVVNATVKSEDVAYLIYTSGSTGQPKGVLIEHASVLNLANVMCKKFAIGPGKRILSFASYTFDASVWEIFGCLLSGGTLCLIDKKEILPGQPLIDTINNKSITHITLPPSALVAMPYTEFPSLEVMVSAGEACLLNLQKKWANSKFKFFNAYGPTEVTVCGSIIEITASNLTENIGNTIDNVNFYVLNEDSTFTKNGEVGELCIGGVGLARGYLNKPEETNNSFVKLSLDEHGLKTKIKIYKTGDLVRKTDDNQLIFIGRKDQQIKYNGYRVELGEIEIVLNLEPSIEEAILCYQLIGNRNEIIAYCKCVTGGGLNVHQIKKYLLQHFPDYMVPKVFIEVTEFPLNENGKVNRKMLRPSTEQLSQVEASEENISKHNIAHAVVKICKEILSIENVHLEDNFFDIGGHSLLLTQLVMLIKNRLNVKVTIAEVVEVATLGDLANIISSRIASEQSNQEIKESNNLKIIPDLDNSYKPFPMLEMQQAYYLGRSGYFELSDVSTNVYREFKLTDLNLVRLEASLNRMIQLHDMLRCKIVDEKNQQIMQEIPFYNVEIYDLTVANEQQISSHLSHIRKKMSIEKLAADTPPLISVKVTKLPHEYRLHICIDALIIDGWSYYIFFSQWEQLYNNLDVQITKTSYSFRDYVLLEPTIRSGEQYDVDKAYWLQHLANLPLGPSLPQRKPPKEVKNQATSSLCKIVDSKRWQGLKAVLKEYDLKDTSFLITLFAEVIGYWSSSNHFTLSLPVFNRFPVDKNINELMGVFTSLILLEVDRTVTESDSLIFRIKKLQNQLYQDMNYRLFSGIEIQRAHRKLHSYVSTGTLMPIVFTSFISAAELANKNSLFSFKNVIYSSTQTSQVWLDAKVHEEEGSLIIEWDYIEEIFPPGMIEAMFNTYCSLLDNFSRDKSVWECSPIKLISDYNFNKMDLSVERHSDNELVHMEFNKVVKEYPDNTAVIDKNRSLTYAELNNHTDQLAVVLKSKGASQGQLVGIIMHRCVEQVISIIATLKSGAAYVPIDPDFPDNRIAQIMDSANIKTVITVNDLEKRLLKIIETKNNNNSVNIINIDDQPNSCFVQLDNELDSIEQSGDSLAYVIFTSGSTGIPKGVMISHASVMNTLKDINDKYKVNSDDKVLSVSNLTFDLSVYDILGLLLKGGTVVMIESGHEKDPEHWIKLIKKHNISIWNSVPMLAQMMVEYSNYTKHTFPSTLRLFLLSGDWVPLSLPDDIRRLHGDSENINIVSLGGATECSIWSVYYDINAIDASWKSIPYGFPMKNQTIYVLDENMGICPKYVVGDIYIGGSGVAHGYLNDQKKTAESFFNHPITGERMYRTGDLGRYMFNDAIEFMGRRDYQVKIGGYRIELEEIQHHLFKYQKVENAHVCVIKRSTGKIKIVAFITFYKPNDHGIAEHLENIKDILSRTLPEYMIPHLYISLDELPLSANGKVDNVKLQEIANLELDKNDSIKKSLISSKDKKLANIWQNLLGCNDIDQNSDFFDLGGTSLTQIRLMSEINNKFQIKIDMSQLLRHRTLGQQSLLIEKLQKLSASISIELNGQEQKVEEIVA